MRVYANEFASQYCPLSSCSLFTGMLSLDLEELFTSDLFNLTYMVLYLISQSFIHNLRYFENSQAHGLDIVTERSQSVFPQLLVGSI